MPDGVGVGMIFRVQPAVVIKGADYSYNKNWNTHGWAPVTVMIKEKSCTIATAIADGKSCLQRDVSLVGRDTKPVWWAQKFTAAETQPVCFYVFVSMSVLRSASVCCCVGVLGESVCLHVCVGVLWRLSKDTTCESRARGGSGLSPDAISSGL